MKWTVTVLWAALIVLPSCSDKTAKAVDASTDSAKPPGTELGPCYPNGTCNAGLTCASGVCVALPDASADVPQAEDGTATIDVEIDAGVDVGVDLSPSELLKLHWQQTFPVSGPLSKRVIGYGVALDGSNNAYVTGRFHGTADLGGSNVTDMGGDDIFITSFTSLGTHRWQKALGGTGDDVANGVAVDGGGNVYVTGKYSLTANLGGGDISSEGSDLYITSFTPAGTHRWQKALAGGYNDHSWSVVADGSGNIYVTGQFWGTIDLGGGSVTAEDYQDIFVTSFTSSGTHRWYRTFKGGSAKSRSVAVDGSGNVYVVGSFWGTNDLGGGTITANPIGTDVYVTSFTSSGTHRWQKAVGGNTSTDEGQGVAVDGSGNVYVTGYFDDTSDFGGGNCTCQGGNDVFLTSFTDSGTHRWQETFGGSSDDFSYGIAVDGDSNIYVTGRFSGTADLGGGTITSQGTVDMFVTSFTSSGKHRSQSAPLADSVGYGVAADGSGNVYVTGHVQDDGVLLKLGP